MVNISFLGSVPLGVAKIHHIIFGLVNNGAQEESIKTDFWMCVVRHAVDRSMYIFLDW